MDTALSFSEVNFRIAMAKKKIRSVSEVGRQAGISTAYARQIVLGQPKEYPVRLMEELKAKLPARPEVRAAYIAQMFEEGSMPAGGRSVRVKP